MSPLGKWLLENCDENLRINLNNFDNTLWLRRYRLSAIRIVALVLGVKLEGAI